MADVSEQLRRIVVRAEGALLDVEYIKSDDIVDDAACDQATERLNGILADVRAIEVALGLDDNPDDVDRSDEVDVSDIDQEFDHA